MEEDLRRERGRATRERLVAVGRELFGARGYEATSIDAVMDRAGVTRGGLYHHFDSKQALFDAILEDTFITLAERVAEAARGKEPVEALRDGCRAWVLAALDPAIQRIVVVEPASVVGWERWRELDDLYVLGRLRRTLERIAAAGRLPSEHVPLLTSMVLASVSEAAIHIARSDDQADALVAGLATLDFLLDRLIAPVAQP
jgi:AcrR family transcriptional regulator